MMKTRQLMKIQNTFILTTLAFPKSFSLRQKKKTFFMSDIIKTSIV